MTVEYLSYPLPSEVMFLPDGENLKKNKRVDNTPNKQRVYSESGLIVEGEKLRYYLFKCCYLFQVVTRICLFVEV